LDEAHAKAEAATDGMAAGPGGPSVLMNDEYRSIKRELQKETWEAILKIKGENYEIKTGVSFDGYSGRLAGGGTAAGFCRPAGKSCDRTPNGHIAG
jgi:hypothetical protein